MSWSYTDNSGREIIRDGEMTDSEHDDQVMAEVAAEEERIANSPDREEGAL